MDGDESDTHFFYTFTSKAIRAYRKLSALEEVSYKRKMKQFDANLQHFSHFLKGRYRARRSIKVLSDLRVILTICEECRRVPVHMKINNCEDCSDMPDNNIIIWTIGTHKTAY